MKDTELSSDFDPLVDENFETAHNQYKLLREKCPVAHSNAYGGYWALFKYDDIVKVLKNPKLYTTTVQNVVPKVATTGRRPPLHLDPPEHSPYKRTLVPFLKKEKMDELEPYIRKTIVNLLNPFIKKGGGDICEEFSHKLPGYVFAHFFNLSTDLSMSIREITKRYVKALNEEKKELIQQASLELYDIARSIIQSRKDNPMDPEKDVKSAYLNQTYKGEPLPDDLILGTIRQLIVVGMIAPVVFTGSITVHLAQNQYIQDQLRNNLELVPSAIEEYFRLMTPYRGFARTPNRDVEIRGRKMNQLQLFLLQLTEMNPFLRNRINLF